MSHERAMAHFSACSHALHMQQQAAAVQCTRIAEQMADALLNGQHVYSAGLGHSAALAGLFSRYMLHGYATDRPGLPAIWLNPAASAVSELRGLSQTLSAVGHSGDFLLFLASGRDDIGALLQQAHDNGLHLVLIKTRHTPCEALQLGENDHLLDITEDTPARALELQLTCLHAICDLVEHLIFGTP